jgi:hypothetical protein
VLVVVASGRDEQARALVRGWPDESRVLTPRDLSIGGWRHRVGSTDNSAVIDGRLARAEDIDGVLTRLPVVDESELGRIVAGDRGYVAAEMTAWLAGWLSDLRCPVLNRPSPLHLMGPPWTREQWLLTARRLGIRVVAAQRSTLDAAAASLPGAVMTVTVVGGRAVGGASVPLSDAAVALAEIARVELLRAHFASNDPDAPFVAADYWVDPLDADVRAALLERLASAGRR